MNRSAEKHSTRILIVEDDYISRNLLKKMLLAMGCPVLEADNGRKAWDIIREESPNLIITDWLMPEMDGLALCRNIRAASFPFYIYIIMLTAKDRKKDLVEVFGSGADDYIPKPFDPEELRARVMTGLRIVELEVSHKDLLSVLVESRNRLRIIFDALPEQIVSVDREGTVISANERFIDVFAGGSREIVGRNCRDACNRHSDFEMFFNDINPLVRRVFDTGEIQSTLVKGADPRGLMTSRQTVCVPMKDALKQVFQTVVITQDMTAEQRKTEEIEKLNARLMDSAAQLEAKNRILENTLKRLEETQAQMLHSEKMASIGQLAAGVAHEINNPAGFVGSNLKTLGDYHKDMAGLFTKFRNLLVQLAVPDMQGVLPAPIAAQIDVLKENQAQIDIDYVMNDIPVLIGDCREGIDRIRKIVSDLQGFAHPGECLVQSTDINKGLASTLNVVGNELKYKAAIHCDFGPIPMVRGYPTQLNQVFLNILVNAAQAIDQKGEIHIKTRVCDGMVEVMISDTGCGISAENIPRIFDPFFTTKDVGKGTGLGMNIAYNIVKKHQGRIEVQSQVGKGTTFTVKIPAEIEPRPLKEPSGSGLFTDLE